ncbi:MAG: HDOD domain-containing protein [Treponema sp.]
MSETGSTQVNTEKIRQAVQMGVPISINSYTLPRETEAYIMDVARAFLKAVNKEDIEDYIVYCLNELTTNAKKANTKRMYFQEKGFDIFDQAAYDEGIKNFKQESLSNINYYLEQQKKHGLYIKVIMQAKKDALIFEVRNNVQMVATEFKRIFDRMVVAREYDSVDEAFLQAIDDTEGAGLGLIIMLLMLKKMGLKEEAFELISSENITVSRITIPRNFEVTKYVTELSKVIVDYINEIPQFPEKIMQIQHLINDPNAKMATIASLISDDLSLTTDLLKLVNSAAFGLTKKCMNINEAVKLAGIRGIQNLLYSVGTLQVLNVTSDEQKAIWEHTYKSAFFASMIAKRYGKYAILDDVYVCALLHDLGRIVFSSLYPEVLAKITAAQEEKNIPPYVMQSIMSGMEHHIIGYNLAEKWNLPDAIISTIKYQYEPEAAPEEYYELIATVSLAEFMLQFYQGSISYEQIPSALLELYTITGEEQLMELCSELDKKFKDDDE